MLVFLFIACAQQSEETKATGWKYAGGTTGAGTGSSHPQKKAVARTIIDKPATAQPARNVAAPASAGKIKRTGKINISFDETPVDEVVEFFRRITELNFVLDPGAVEELGGADNLLVTLKLYDITVKNALNHALKPLGLSWCVKDEAVFISTPDRISDNRSQRMVIYDVSDLLLKPSGFSGGSGSKSKSRR